MMGDVTKDAIIHWSLSHSEVAALEGGLLSWLEACPAANNTSNTRQ